jgi:dUTP pyrophosphatase
MELGQLKKSVQDIARIVGAVVEEKLGERSQVEEQVRGFARQVEAIVVEAVKTATSNMSARTSSVSSSNSVTLKFKKLAHYKGDLPAYQTEGSSGMDVRACLEEEVSLAPGERALIPTGLSLEIPLGYEVQVRPRSGLAVKKGVSLVNTPGTIDADYRGEVKIILINLGQEKLVIQDQERIAQLVVCPVVQANIELSEDLTETERGAGGFGSTGV